jgi:hypothetical protein
MTAWTAQTAPQFLLELALTTLAGIATVWLFTRAPSTRNAFRRVLDAPGVLVPLFVATLLLWVVWHQLGALPTENPIVRPPWWAWLEDSAGDSLGLVPIPNFLVRWSIVAVVAAALAGQLGLLEATARGERPTGSAMLRGVRSHFAAMIVARSLLAFAVFFIASSLPDTSGVMLVPLLLIPGALIAPVLGATTTSPGRPFRAVHDGLTAGFRHLFRHGSLALRELLAMVLLAWTLRQVHATPHGISFSTDLEGTAHNATFDLIHGGTVSYDFAFLTPFVWDEAAWLDLPALACGLFLQAVFVTAHFEACRTPTAPASRPRS